MIPLQDCKHRHIYQIDSRHLSIGVFDVNKKGFVGIRTKFRERFLSTEYHWDTGEPHGTVQPQQDLGEIPSYLSLNENDGV